MKDIYKEVHENLKQYKLTKEQRAIFYQQIQDVVEQMDEEQMDDEFLKDLINDIFAYNDIEKIVQKEKGSFNYENIFWGLFLIFISILIILEFNIWLIINILVIPLMLYFLIKRWFLLALLSFYLILDFIIGMPGISVGLGLIIAYIGFKILFAKKNKRVRFERMNLAKKHAEHINAKYNAYYTKEDKEKMREKIDNEVLFINNNYGGTNMELTDENIGYINLQNKCGGIELDLKSFQFPKGDLVININNTLGGGTIYINDETEVKFMIDSKFGGVGNKHYYSTKNIIKHKVYIQGENRFGGLDIK